jgi:hypothetical protein
MPAHFFVLLICDARPTEAILAFLFWDVRWNNKFRIVIFVCFICNIVIEDRCFGKRPQNTALWLAQEGHNAKMCRNTCSPLLSQSWWVSLHGTHVGITYITMMSCSHA